VSAVRLGVGLDDAKFEGQTPAPHGWSVAELDAGHPRRGRSGMPAFRRAKATVPGSTDTSAPMEASEEPDRYKTITSLRSFGSKASVPASDAAAVECLRDSIAVDAELGCQFH